MRETIWPDLTESGECEMEKMAKIKFTIFDGMFARPEKLSHGLGLMNERTHAPSKENRKEIEMNQRTRCLRLLSSARNSYRQFSVVILRSVRRIRVRRRFTSRTRNGWKLVVSSSRGNGGVVCVCECAPWPYKIAHESASAWVRNCISKQ